MKKTAVNLLIAILFIQKSSCAQVCEDFLFVKDKLIKEYPAITKLRVNWVKTYYNKNKHECDRKNCFEYISKMLLLFNDKHLTIYDLAYYKNLDTVENYKTIATAKKYLQNNNLENQTLEGYWINEYFNAIVALIKEGKNKYKAILINGKKTNRIKNGNVLFVIEKENNIFPTLYIDPKAGYRVYTKTKYVNDTIFTVGQYGKWTKIKNIDIDLDSYPLFSYSPSLNVIDSNNILITLHDFRGKQKKILDSLIYNNWGKIRKTKNLILDIRNNLGGTISVYDTLLPLIYTKPIYQTSAYTFCSNYIIEDAYSDLKTSIQKKDTLKEIKYKSYYELVLKNRYKLLLENGDTIKNKSILEYPKNVAVLCNYATLSAAEMMLLDFKQSKKVNVFGEATAGGIDHLSYYSTELPVSKYSFFMATTKRKLNKNETFLDGIGIKPDVNINPSINDWILFVKQYYEKK